MIRMIATWRVFNNRIRAIAKARACYQHSCLQYVSGQKMTNESFRHRLNIDDKNYSIASRIISDTLSRQLIKPYNENQSRKYAQYIPWWA